MKIAVAGLSLADTLIIQSHFIQLAPQVRIKWLGLDAADADALIFRARFLHTPTIESWINAAQEDTVIAAVYRNEESSIASRAAGVHLLDLSRQDTEALTSWIETIIQKKTNLTQVQQTFSHVEETIPSAGMEKPPPQAADNSRLRSAQTDPDTPISDFSSTSEIFHLIRSGVAMLANTAGYLVCVQPQHNKVWTNHPKDRIPPFDACQWQRFEGGVPAGLPIVLDLRQWLWESLWNSALDFSSYIQEDTPYLLRVWPQPRGTANRTIILWIAALLQKGPASVASLSSLTQVPAERIKKLLYTMQLVDFVREVQTVQTSRKPQEMEWGRLTRPVRDEMRMDIFKRIRRKFNLFSA